MRAVLDVNILASAAVFPDRKPGTVVERALTRQYDLVLSEPIMERLSIVLTRRYFAERLSEIDRTHFLDDLCRDRTIVTPERSVRNIAPDAEDDLVLGTAVAASADFLVTGDKGLLAIGTYGSVRIVTAEVFLQALEQA